VQVITLERPLPYPIAPGVNRVSFHERASTISESGVEGMTLRFKWELYAGHHVVSDGPELALGHQKAPAGGSCRR
jgi:hypothetical protein